ILLLAQGHSCEDFDGMCCVNLSDHSTSIYKQLQALQENMKKIIVVHSLLSPFLDWLQSL
ncbi:hypothetical protein M959_07713, partial [Chaetura pelagica]